MIRHDESKLLDWQACAGRNEINPKGPFLIYIYIYNMHMIYRIHLYAVYLPHMQNTSRMFLCLYVSMQAYALHDHALQN